MRTLKLQLTGASLALLLGAGPSPAPAASLGNSVWLGPSAEKAQMIDVRRVVRRTRVGPGGRVVHSRTVVNRGPWIRPPHYRWRPGAAVAAGAALGFVAAATAVAWAGPAPAPGMCWYYTDSSRRTGYWDYCP